MKISEIICKLTEFHPQVDESRTCDTLKYGDAEQECTGIVVTCFASAEVIREAARLGANFIITHEPTFWTHEDETDWLAESDVFKAKRELLDRHNIVVFRDHDRIHGGKPSNNPDHIDGIFYGIMKELGWEEYKLNYPNKPLLFQIPETDAEELGRFLMEKLHLKGLRILGDRHTKVSRVFFCEHVKERDWKEKDKIRQTELDNIDALIPFEIIDWTLAAFVRDCAQMGHPKVMYNVGHFNMEELGMKFMAKWLPTVVGDIPVHHVFSGDAYDFLI